MDTLTDTLWNEFAIETEEHLEAVEPILMQADPQHADRTDIAQLFRSFHSIKGLAAAMDARGMESVAHHAESLLGLVRDGGARLTPELAELLLQSVDALKRLRAAVIEQRRDATPEPELIARLADAFTRLGGAVASDMPSAAATPNAATGTPLHDDPEMLAIFIEMVQAHGPELCAAPAEDAAERAGALDAAETLAHAAEVMNFDALAASFAGLRDLLQEQAAADGLAEPGRRELLARLGEIDLQIELLGEITGQDAGSAPFASALARRIGNERHHLAVALAALNQRLPDDLANGSRVVAQADAAAMTQMARRLRQMTVALSLGHTADLMLLIEDFCARVASGAIEPSQTVIAAADAVFAQIARHTEADRIEDLAEAEADALTARLRAPLMPIAHKALQDGGRLVAGLRLPMELLAVLSDENLAELERGIAQDGLLPYEILAHLETDREIATGLIGWLTAEARTITNRTVITDGESWFAMLVLSRLEPEALAQTLANLDPERRCIKRLRRLTASAGDESVIEPPRESANPAPGGAAGAAANLIRVRGEVVDAFLDDIGDLRATAATLTHLIRGVGSRAIQARAQGFVARLPSELRAEFLATFHDYRERDRRLLETEELVSRMLGRLHQGALELRVVPVDVVFNRLRRLVRDLAQRHGKSVELVLDGRDVRIDKSMVEALTDPLIHLVRNAVDHGIEPPVERRSAGKPERARLTLRALQRGSEIDIEIADDGRGLDAVAIRARAVARGLLPAAQADALADADIFPFIFEAGLSTAPTVTETSGRGVGMDIVLAAVRRFNGDIAIRSERGRGTIFTLVLPISAALQTALLVRVGTQSLAIPERHVVSVAEIDTDAIRLIGNHRSILYRETVLPLYDLGDLLGMPSAGAGVRPRFAPIVAVGNSRQTIGLEVDVIERRQELFLKDLDPRLASFPGIGGTSVLGDGRVVLVLEGDELLQLAARGIEPAAAAANGNRRMAS